MQTPRDVIKYREDDNQAGFDYTNQIFKRTLSSVFFLDEKRGDILIKLEEIFYFLIETVKDLRKMTNWSQNTSNKNMN